MRIGGSREGRNVEGRRGTRIGRLGVLVSVAALLVLVAGYFLRIDPLRPPGLAKVARQAAPAPTGQPADGSPQDPGRHFAVRVLAETGDVWGRKIAELGGRYPPPSPVLFTGEVESACGMPGAVAGPFYCPGDQRVYLDLGFLEVLQGQSGSSGDLARAYVIAHAVGHHMQALLGATEAVQKVRQRSAPEVVRRALVAMELQADCYAGIWAREADALHRASGERPYIKVGDIWDALNGAADAGAAAVKRNKQSRIMPETFGHGTPEQRTAWFRRGFETGRIQHCDTFNSPSL